jgi:hypothetical protein
MFVHSILPAELREEFDRVFRRSYHLFLDCRLAHHIWSHRERATDDEDGLRSHLVQHCSVRKFTRLRSLPECHNVTYFAGTYEALKALIDE